LYAECPQQLINYIFNMGLQKTTTMSMGLWQNLARNSWVKPPKAKVTAVKADE